eukprot:4437617-Alexandrium_andersonii.AAC.1
MGAHFQGLSTREYLARELHHLVGGVFDVTSLASWLGHAGVRAPGSTHPGHHDLEESAEVQAWMGKHEEDIIEA